MKIEHGAKFDRTNEKQVKKKKNVFYDSDFRHRIRGFRHKV